MVAGRLGSDPVAVLVFDAGTDITTTGRQPLAASFNAHRLFDASAREGGKKPRNQERKSGRDAAQAIRLFAFVQKRPVA